MRFLFLFIFLICCCWGFSQKISNDIIPFKKENKWGLCYKSSDSIIAKPVYSKIDGFFIHESDASHLIYNVFTSNKMGLVNSYGKLCIDTIYNTIAPINEYKYNTYEIIGEPRFLVSINNKYGIVDFNGGTQLPLKFADIREYPLEYNDTTLNLYEAITNDSVFFYDKTNRLLLSLKSGPNTDIIEYYEGKWIFRITDDKNISHLGIINDKGKIIVNALNRGIYSFGKYQKNPNTFKGEKTCFKLISYSSNKVSERLLLNNEGKLGLSFEEIERQISDSVFVVRDIKSKKTLLYNKNRNQLMKINGSLNYDLNVFSDDLPNVILYTLTQNKKTSIIDNTLKPLVPFISVDSGYYYFDYDYRNNCIEKISADEKERIYYDLKGRFLVKTTSDFVYIRNANVLSNYYLFKNPIGDTLLYNKNGIILLNYIKTDTLCVYAINRKPSVAYMSSRVSFYKVKDKAVFIDSGYFYPTGSSGLPDYFLLSDSSYYSPYSLLNKYGKIYSKNLDLLAKGLVAFNYGYRLVTLSDNRTRVYNNNGELILQDTCYPIFDDEYIKGCGPVNYPSKPKGYKRWRAYLYDNVDTTAYTDYVSNWPMYNMNRVKIKNKWFVTDKDFKILHELDDTVSTNNTAFFNRFINDLKLHTLPISLKRAKDILKEYDTIIPGTNIYYKPEFFAALKNGKFTLFDSLGNRLAVVDRKIIKSDVKPLPNYNLINGTFIDGNILYCYKHQPVVKFKIDTVKYDFKDFRFSYKHLYFLRHSSNRTLYDIVNTKGEILHENVLVQSHTFSYTIDYTKPFIIHCLDGTSKLLNPNGQVLYQENKSFNLYEDFITKLWYCAYYTEYPIPKENILFYLNKENKPVLIN